MLIKIPPLDSHSFRLPSPSPVEPLQAKFPVEGRPSLLLGIAFFCLKIIHLLLRLPPFFLFFKMYMKSLHPPQIFLLRLGDPQEQKPCLIQHCLLGACHRAWHMVDVE